MFEPRKLEHFLDSLQVETHFPDTMPQKVIELPRSVLDEKMDRMADDNLTQHGQVAGAISTLTTRVSELAVRVGTLHGRATGAQAQ